MTEVATAIVLVILAVLYFAAKSRAGSPLEGNRYGARVSYIYDGDTVQLEQNKTRVRLWGIDAPEKGSPGADAARNALIKLVDGKRVEILPIDKDRYGRTVGRIFRNGQDISAVMIERGHALEYCRFSKGFYGTCE